MSILICAALFYAFCGGIAAEKAYHYFATVGPSGDGLDAPLALIFGLVWPLAFEYAVAAYCHDKFADLNK